MDEKERELQKRILRDPSLIDGFDKPAAVADEVPVRRAGKADVVLVNAEGKIAIIECKRARNPESSRSVIGQVLQYAAGLWKLGYEDFRHLLAACGTLDVAKWDEETFRTTVSESLRTGDFELFIAVDEMTKPLRKKLGRTVTFLNRMPGQVQLLVLEMIPRDGPRKEYGKDVEVVAALPPRLEPSRWTLMREIRSSPGAARAAEGLLHWAEEKADVAVSYSRKHGLGRGRIRANPNDTLFQIKEERSVRVSLQGLRGHWNDDEVEQFVQRLVEIDPQFQIDTTERTERPEAPLESLAQESKRKDFLALMEQALDALNN